jgi:hypothetical protein
MTLRELAEKKSESQRPRLKLSVGAARPPPSASPRRALPSFPDERPGPESRLLGTENLTDMIPMFPPRGDGPEREWEQATMLPAGSLGIVLDSTERTAWIASSRPGLPPLLLFPLPVLGRLNSTPMSPLEPLDPQSPPVYHGRSNCQTSPGNVPSVANETQSLPKTAPSAG